jgi:hypothetical protein
LLDFIDNRVREDDLVAITSPSGQIGFLQQLTANKDALHSAVDRLNYRTNTKPDMDRPPMSEYVALKIREGDDQAMAYYVQEIQKQSCYRAGDQTICSVTPQGAREMVKVRANQIAIEAGQSTN